MNYEGYIIQSTMNSLNLNILELNMNFTYTLERWMMLGFCIELISFGNQIYRQHGPELRIKRSISIT